jgi:hypothetical protein
MPAERAGDMELFPQLLGAMADFCRAYSHFESTVADSHVRRSLARSATLNEAALAPLSHKIFSFETALKWGAFLAHAPRQLCDEDGPMPPAFDVGVYMAALGTYYDRAMEDLVWGEGGGYSSDSASSSGEADSGAEEAR